MARHRFSCQHTGYGKFCHRCLQAEVLEKLIENKQLYSPPNLINGEKQKPWTMAQMAEEAKRLRNDGKGRRAVEVDTSGI